MARMEQRLTGGTEVSTDTWGRDFQVRERPGQGSKGENTCMFKD